MEDFRCGTICVSLEGRHQVHKSTLFLSESLPGFSIQRDNKKKRGTVSLKNGLPLRERIARVSWDFFRTISAAVRRQVRLIGPKQYESVKFLLKDANVQCVCASDCYFWEFQGVARRSCQIYFYLFLLDTTYGWCLFSQRWGSAGSEHLA